MEKKERENLNYWHLKALQMYINGRASVENTTAFYQPSFGECLVAIMLLAKHAFCRKKGNLFILIGKTTN